MKASSRVSEFISTYLDNPAVSEKIRYAAIDMLLNIKAEELEKLKEDVAFFKTVEKFGKYNQREAS